MLNSNKPVLLDNKQINFSSLCKLESPIPIPTNQFTPHNCQYNHTNIQHIIQQLHLPSLSPLVLIVNDELVNNHRNTITITPVTQLTTHDIYTTQTHHMTRQNSDHAITTSTNIPSNCHHSTQSLSGLPTSSNTLVEFAWGGTTQSIDSFTSKFGTAKPFSQYTKHDNDNNAANKKSASFSADDSSDGDIDCLSDSIELSSTDDDNDSIHQSNNQFNQSSSEPKGMALFELPSILSKSK